MQVQITARALAQVGASPVLALDPTALQIGVALSAEEPTDSSESSAGGIDPSKVAIVVARGPLAQRARRDLCAFVDGYDALEARFAKALQSDASSVLLAIDSPGGDVAGLEEAVGRMRAARDRSGKPVVVYVDELAASAAYWIAAALGDAIVAPGAARVGSIGCIGALVDETEALKKEGIAVTLIREPAGKADGHPAGPIAELAKERVTSLVRAAATRFYAAIAQHRGLKTKAIQGLDGEVFEASAALERGLIDQVGGRDVAISRAMELARSRRMDEEQKKELAALRGAAIEITKLSADAKTETLVGALVAVGAKAARADALEAEAKAKAEAEAKAQAEAQAAAEKAKAEAEKAEHAALVQRLYDERKLSHTQRDWAMSVSLETLKGFAATAAPFAPPAKQAAGTTAPVDAELAAELKKRGVTQDDYRRFHADMYGPTKGEE